MDVWMPPVVVSSSLQHNSPESREKGKQDKRCCFSGACNQLPHFRHVSFDIAFLSYLPKRQHIAYSFQFELSRWARLTLQKLTSLILNLVVPTSVLRLAFPVDSQLRALAFPNLAALQFHQELMRSFFPSSLFWETNSDLPMSYVLDELSITDIKPQWYKEPSVKAWPRVQRSAISPKDRYRWFPQKKGGVNNVENVEATIK